MSKKATESKKKKTANNTQATRPMTMFPILKKNSPIPEPFSVQELNTSAIIAKRIFFISYLFYVGKESIHFSSQNTRKKLSPSFIKKDKESW